MHEYQFVVSALTATSGVGCVTMDAQYLRPGAAAMRGEFSVFARYVKYLWNVTASYHAMVWFGGPWRSCPVSDAIRRRVANVRHAPFIAIT